MQVVKRNGDVVPYDYNRILNAIKAARDSVNLPVSDDKLRKVADAVEDVIQNYEKISVEEIQDVVEMKLMTFGLNEVARHYVLYRQKHSIRRQAGTHLMDTYKEIFFADSKDVDHKRDNANINTDASMGIMLKLGTEGAKYFVDNYVLPEEFVKADKEGYIHIHENVVA